MQTDANHTPEPWELHGDTIQGAPELNGEQPHAVESTCVAVVLSRERGSYRHYPKERARANANRIVACVNACAGLADPGVVPEMLAALAGIFQHCAMIHKRWGDWCNRPEADAAIAAGRAALVKAGIRMEED